MEKGEAIKKNLQRHRPDRQTAMEMMTRNQYSQ